MSHAISPCPFPAHQRPGDSLAAPAAVGQGVDTSFTGRNFHQWRAISYFLGGFEVLASARAQAEKTACAAHAGFSAGAAQAGVSALPDGNHGDNRRSIK